MSKKDKKAFLATVETLLKKIDKNNPSIPILIKCISSLSNAQFEEYIERLRNGVKDRPDYNKPRDIIPLVIEPLKKHGITVRGNIKLGREWGIEFFERIWMVDPTTKVRYKTNIPYAVLELPIIRQAQTLEKGIGYSESDTTLDTRTGQVVNRASGAGISSPELQSLLSQGRTKTAIELLKYRGGDDKAYRSMTRSLSSTGKFSLSAYNEPTRATSSDVVSIYFKAKHIDNNI